MTPEPSIDTEYAAPPKASALVVMPFALAAQAHGLQVRQSLNSIGLSLEKLQDAELRVDRELVEELLRDATDARGLRDLGLLAAERVEPLHLDVIEYLARCQPTLWNAFERWQRYMGLLHDDCALELKEEGERVVIEVRIAGKSQAALHEFLLAVTLLTARRISGNPQLAPLEACFSHERPQSTERHEQIFRCPLQFHSRETALVFSRRTLDAHLPHADAGLAEVLDRVAAESLQKLGRRADLLEQARDLVRRQIKRGVVPCGRVARQLGMSPRTLHRKLAMQGTTYRSLHDELRRELALHIVRDPALSISEIIQKLGFSNGPAFHRAFRRWTGTTASSYRAELNKFRLS